MGVRGLETFLQRQVPNGVVSVNILEEIHRKKGEDPDQPVVLVFQVIDLLFNIALNLSKTEVICGPAYRKVHDIFDQRLKQLKNTGADLHFFQDGPIPNYDFKKWARKQSEKYIDNITIINSIDSNVPIDEIDIIEKPPGATTPLYDLLEICRKYGTLHQSLTSKQIVDVVKYSNENNTLAVIANSSNYLIFNGTWRYWSGRHLDENWNTLEYNRTALLEHIGLSQSQMPLLATAAGNDFVPYEGLTSFHKKIHGGAINYYKEHFPKLAEYVKKFPDVLSSEESHGISSDLFGSKNVQHYEKVCGSLNFYMMNILVTQETDSLLLCATFDRKYYHSLAETPIRLNLPSFYDLRRTDFLPYFDIELPILKRRIGLVRRHKNDKDYKQVIEAKFRHSEPHQSVRIIPEYPIVEIPELMELTFNKTNDYFNRLRFKLLKWIVFGDDFQLQFSIEEIPEGYMVTVVTLMYLAKLKQLTTTEVDAILLSSHLINTNKDYANDIGPPTNITSRDLIVSHLYICMYNIVVKCFLTVGLDKFVDYLYFDGVFFIYWLNKIKADDQDEIISQIEYLKYFLRFVSD